jgi:hypothetical protein
MLRRLALLLLLGLLLPASAHAGAFGKEGTTLVYTGSDGVDQLSGYPSGTTLIFTTFPAGTTASPESGCAFELGNWRCPTTPYTRYEARGHGGDDLLYGLGILPATLDGGAGKDLLDGSDQADVLLGGPGDDWLRADQGGDDLQGGPGDDRLEGGTGGDTFSGGDGVDVVNYVYASVGVRVTIDGVPGDGEPSEGDNVLGDVENLWGSTKNDELTGSPGANAIEGGAGDDTIAGLGGRDELFGEEDDDTILARDGVGEPVECGAGTDIAVIDLLDGEPNECEVVDPSDAEQPDLDRDGVLRPADCDDRDPARRPGLPDVPENGIDEDCSGADAPQLDRDADGFPVPRDCDDGDAAVKPGAREVPGNRADENCDGRAQPLPLVGVSVADTWTARGGIARIVRLQLERVKRGTVVQLRCKGKGCAFKRRTLTAAKQRTLQLQRVLKRVKLRKGTVLELWITRPQTTGSVVRFTGRWRGIPARRHFCLPPGGKPGRCS